LPKSQLSPIRQAQKRLTDNFSEALDAGAQLSRRFGEGLRHIDEQTGVTDVLRKGGLQLGKSYDELDQKLNLSNKGAGLRKIVRGKASSLGQLIRTAGDRTGTTELMRRANQLSSRFIEQYAFNKRIYLIGQAFEELYGATRQVIKPYLLPETPNELLQNTKKELVYISACIMQISASESEKVATQFGNVVASKIIGVASSGAILSLVGTFGTAGTGTAIASLSGAASTSASLAWLGGLLGGGMATGAVLTGGVAVIAGLGAYKVLGSNKREFEDLEPVEQQIVQYCWFLISSIDEYLNNPDKQLTPDQARGFLKGTLKPLYALLHDNEAQIAANLDTKNAVAFRQHVLKDYEPVVLEPFERYVIEQSAERTQHYEYVIGGVLYALLTRSAVDDSKESQFVLTALRRSDSDLTEASEAEISEYLAGYDESQLIGIANNVKGIVHELLWIDAYNEANTSTQAELFGETNHPGADVRIYDTQAGETVTELQLKATNSVSYIEEHQLRYTEIEVVATNEVAADMDYVTASGYNNDELIDLTSDTIGNLTDNSVEDRVLESSALAATAATGQELLAMLQGRKEFPDAAKSALEKTGTAGAATALVALLFN
jgi:hypothetical protein